MIRFRLRVERTWTEHFEDVDARRFLHLRRAELLQEIVNQFQLEVLDWGETHLEYPREEVTVELEAPSGDVLQAVIDRAMELVDGGHLLDVHVTVGGGSEISLRDSPRANSGRGGSASRPRGGLFPAPPPNGGGGGHLGMANGGGAPDDHPPEMANGGGPDDHPPAMANGGDAPDDHPPEMANGGGPHASPRRPRRRRVVSTGFAEPERRMQPLTGREPLRTKHAYLYWIEIAERAVAGSIEVAHKELVPEETLEDGAEFVVALFAFPDELGIDGSRSVGTFRYRSDDRFVVWRQPGGSPWDGSLYDQDVERRMFFPVTTPKGTGRSRLRCNIYFRGVLVQSRLVTAYVGTVPSGRRAQAARVDFQLAQLDAPGELAPIQQHALSLQLNSNGAATHSFRFASFTEGKTEFKSDAVLSAHNLQDLITQARRAMRKVAWGAATEWTDGTKFRYTAPPFSEEDLAKDLLALMKKGSDLYAAMILDLTGDPEGRAKLRTLMRLPGRVQVVNSGSPSELIPTSLVYDYDNTDPVLGGVTLCPAFVAARAGNDPLEKTGCFNGECPSRKVPQVICPSGFWGYRHAIGIPVRSKSKNLKAAAPLRMKFKGSPSLGIAFFPKFDLVAAHQKRIADQVPGWAIREPADSYEEALAMLKSRPNVVYFYCHGGTNEGNVPYLLVGDDEKKPMLPKSLMARDDELEHLYDEPRSLVILNGCETNALEPSRAVQFVTAFVHEVAAVGVIGTEITTSEELAVAFGEALLSNLRTPLEVGESVRLARLALLKEGNPLGLIYLPFVPADAVLAEEKVN